MDQAGLLGPTKPRPAPIRIVTDDTRQKNATLQRTNTIRESRSDSGVRQSAQAGKVQPLDTSLRLALGSLQPHASTAGIPSPPSTPPTRSVIHTFPNIQRPSTDRDIFSTEDLSFDLKGAELLGSGLWSNVYKVRADEAILNNDTQSTASNLLTPPSTPQKAHNSPAVLFAVKSASRSDALSVFEEEADTLRHIQRSRLAKEFVVPFYGLTNSNSALVFHCSDTTLASYGSRFTDLSSIPTFLPLYQSISAQLIAGLAFLHSQNVIHADVKPANILLDHLPNGQMLARFADFSASIISDSGPEPQFKISSPLPHLSTPTSSAPVSRANSLRHSPALGAGTYKFMAPEQLSSNPITSAPSYATDVYSLGVTLLTFLMADRSPFDHVERESNVFLFREAVKMGTPLVFCRGDDELRRRVKALEGDARGRQAIDELSKALKKDRNQRVVAAAWGRADEKLSS